jgi:prolyl-tRNA editing enzyme YbaK/EbsC (Cys-tRNA(Pro) deacylase)
VTAHFGEALKRPDANAVRELTGFAVGGIPPFGHAAPLPTFIVRDLLQYEIVWAAAGTPLAVFPVDPAKLRDAINATVIDVK